MANPLEPESIWDEPVEPPLGRGAKPATWDHAKWPERAA